MDGFNWIFTLLQAHIPFHYQKEGVCVLCDTPYDLDLKYGLPTKAHEVLTTAPCTYDALEK